MNQHPPTIAGGKATAQHGPASESGSRAISQLQNLWSRVRGKWPLTSIVGFLIGLFIGNLVSALPVAKQPELPSMTQCVMDILNPISQKAAPTTEALRDAREHCYSLIQAQGLLNDFAIRKLDFFQQYRANGILMWMVVTVTFSGVLLAGLQLWASYELAIANRTSLDAGDSQIFLKRDQLVLKSSITGLFILLISFGFFLVFVFYVYKLEPLERVTNQSSPPVPTLPMGALGPPVTTQSKPQ